MSRLKTLFNVLRHPIQTARSYKTFNRFTKSPAFTDTVKKLFNDPNTRTMSFDDLESGAWKNASNAATKALTNYGDDAAKLVSNYGDDAARAVTSYYDDTVGLYDDYIPSGSSYYADALRAVDDIPKFNKGSNVTAPDRTFDFTNRFGQPVSADYNKPGIWNIGGKTFHDLPEGYLPTNQNVLKEELLNKRTGRSYLNAIPREGVDVKFLGDAVQHFDHQNREMFERGPGFTVKLPGWTPTEDLVFDRNSLLRPHKNTALGRWYDEKAYEQMVKDSFLYNDPISPLFDLDEYYKGYTFDDGTLPF